MRIANILIPILLPLSVGGAYFAGSHNAKHDAEIVCKKSVDFVTAFDHSQSLMFATQAIKSLQALKTDEAHNLLVRYTKLLSPAVETCSKSSVCSGLVGFMPTQAQFEEIAGLKEKPLVTTLNTAK
jgi:hypothetical protein